ncbi:MAG: PQQ-binding-like beta-propeller repeat protein [Roseimicrobium sp.]
MSATRPRPPLFPLIVLALVGGLIAWMQATDHIARSMGSIILVLFAVILVSLWWALQAKGQRLKRLGIVTATGIALWFTGQATLRYEGSADGTALPSFAWSWSKKDAPQLAALPAKIAPALDLGPVPAGLADWPRFMGPQGDGMLPAPEWSADWATHAPREVWRQPVGLGWSGFAVLGRRAITQEQRGEDECVTCYDVVTGKLLWSHVDKALFTEGMGGDGPRASPSIAPATGLVYAQGATGILNCLDLATGDLKWTRQVLTEASAKNITWGKCNAPLLHRDLVIVTGGEPGPTVLAYRQADGSPAWRGGEDAASYSTPTVHTLAGREQLVSVNKFSVTGHDLASGAVLWTFPWPSDFPKVTQAVPAGPDRVLVTAGYGMKSHLLEIKTEATGQLTCRPVWSSTHPRTKFSSATIHGGHIFGLDEGTLTCVDLATGERGWREGRYGFGQHLQLGDLLLIQSERGPVVLVRANAEKLIELGRINALSAKTWNPPTLAGRWLLVRNDREAVCYELK